MNVAVVGAGIAGLGAARTLTAAGHSCIVFERTAKVGGRLATHAKEGYVFDTGATSVSPRGMALQEAMLQSLPQEGLVLITKPVYVHTLGRISMGDSRRDSPRYVYEQGINRLPQLLAHGLDIRLESLVEDLTMRGDRYLVEGELYDGVIITAPLPQAIELAGTVKPRQAPGRARHRSCLSICLGYEKHLETPYFATIDPEQQLPLTWLSIESQKCPGRAPAGCTAIVAQMSAAYSQYSYHHTDDRIVSETLVDVVRLLGKEFAVPKVTHIKRWQYSQPEIAASFESVNPIGSCLLIAGDGVSQGRAEFAYASGIQAANRLFVEGSV